MIKLDNKIRYLQIAFNSDLNEVNRILPSIPRNERIFIEAGTPFIKREGMRGISEIASIWGGTVVADLKTADGAVGEVRLARAAGATAATVIGSAPLETIEYFIVTCKKEGMISMVDMIGVDEPWKKLWKLRVQPDVVVIHKGRDEETNKAKVIQYKHINKIRGKFGTLISVAGGVDLRESRSAIFNGANIVVVNIVDAGGIWKGIGSNEDVVNVAQQFLDTIE